MQGQGGGHHPFSPTSPPLECIDEGGSVHPIANVCSAGSTAAAEGGPAAAAAGTEPQDAPPKEDVAAPAAEGEEDEGPEWYRDPVVGPALSCHHHSLYIKHAGNPGQSCCWLASC